MQQDKEPTPALFAHAPRAPHTRVDYPDQLRFGGFYAVNRDDLTLMVYRNAHTNRAALCVNVSGDDVHIDTRFHLTADQMQALACALLDCAHHLRTVPAAPRTLRAVAKVAA